VNENRPQNTFKTLHRAFVNCVPYRSDGFTDLPSKKSMVLSLKASASVVIDEYYGSNGGRIICPYRLMTEFGIQPRETAN